MSYSSTAYSSLLLPPTTIAENAIGYSKLILGDTTTAWGDDDSGVYINNYIVPKGVWLLSGNVNLSNTGAASLISGEVILSINGTLKQYISIYQDVPQDIYGGCLNYVIKSDGTATIYIGAEVNTQNVTWFFINGGLEITRIA